MRLNKVTGVLLINLGTPSAPTKRAVGKYLREFLSDPRVIELPAILRSILVNMIIVPFRSAKSAHAYASIWQDDGSPLLSNSKALQAALQQELGATYNVALGMRYGNPSITDAFTQLSTANIDKLVIVPLFPQYASATNGSALEYALQCIAERNVILPFTVISDFYNNPHYITAQSAVIKPYLEQEYDFLLLSYHGLPQKQLVNPGVDCYSTRCLQSAQLITQELGVTRSKWLATFQSRLGKLEWIKPYTDAALIELRERGVQKILIACPSFVADCLETLEEIGIRAKQDWIAMGGKDLQLIPCLNTHPQWITALQKMVTSNQPF